MLRLRLRSPLRVFNDQGGNVALITALCILPLAFLVGMAIDLSNATRVRVALQAATDSAALAMARNVGSIAVGAESAAAKNYTDASYDKSAPFTISTAAIDRTSLTVTLDAKADVPTIFAGILGKTTLPVSAHSVVKGQGMDYEIALVVDNSGSMTSTAGAGSSKIVELRKAATVLFTELNVNSTSDRVKIAIVPFGSSVKVGTGFATEPWMSTTAGDTKHSENFVQATKRSDLFSQLDVAWAGCVESRVIIDAGGTTRDYDINDATPTSGISETLFLPWFAPDEPDGDNYKSSGSGKYDYRQGSYSNNYLDDEGGDCTDNDAKVKNTDLTKQERVCKYKNPDWSGGGTGPNFQCTTSAITPLTNVRTTLDSAAKVLDANGNTNVSEGLAWGWRVLSPTAPFTEGRPYSTKQLQKIIILMTDGVNNIPGASNLNKSVYSSYGYMKDNRLGTTSNSTSVIRDKMDDRVSKACSLIKSANIIVYTVALGPEADAVELSKCASPPTSSEPYAYAPETGAELTPVFKRIAASINKLRISQ